MYSITMILFYFILNLVYLLFYCFVFVFSWILFTDKFLKTCHLSSDFSANKICRIVFFFLILVTNAVPSVASDNILQHGHDG